MLRVLLVDDEPSVLEGLRIFVDWNRAGYELAGMASDGIMAFSLINDTHPDLVICDIRMPGINGLDLIEKVNNSVKPIPKFLMLSGYNDFTYAQKALQHGALGYLTKPLDQDELLVELARVSAILEDEKRIADETLEMIRYSASQLYKDIISGKNSNRIERKTHFIFNIPPKANLRIVRFITDKTKDKYHIPKYDIYKLLEQIVGMENKNNLFYNGNDSYTFIMHDGMKNFTAYSILADYIATNLNAAAYDDYGISSLWVLISSVASINTLKGICSCEKELEELQIYCLLHPEKNINCYESIGEELPFHGLISNELGMIFSKLPFEGIIYAIKGRNPNKVSSAVSEFFEILVPNAANNEILSICLYRLADLVRKTASSFELEASSAISDFAESIRNKSPNCKRIATNMCQQVFEKLNSNSNKPIVIVENEIINYIKLNCFRNNLSLQTIAKKFSLPAALISKIVKKKTGQKYSDYLNYQRIEYAKKLFASQDMKVATVCEESGYSDYDYFTKKFRELTGVSPSEYKKKYS